MPLNILFLTNERLLVVHGHLHRHPPPAVGQRVPEVVVQALAHDHRLLGQAHGQGHLGSPVVCGKDTKGTEKGELLMGESISVFGYIGK